ncbi:MAG: DNA-directed RNA polymerase sigma-70 factor [Gemmatales bacterium]|nr:MAG: DNA-directed RNA polymerase sigma-70 factor [Gemmatales bacterium]
MMEPFEADETRLEQCLELFARYQQRLYLFIAAMLPSPADAEEVLQEVNIVVWKKFEQFEPGSDFLSWVYRIATLQVREYKRRRGRETLSFSPEMLDQLMARALRDETVLERRREALQKCLEKLSPADKQLVDRCYAPGAKIPEVAEQLKRTATSVYRSLRRIRQILTECVNGELAK